LSKPPLNPKFIDEPGRLTSMTLLEQIKVHDQDAWQRLVALYTPLLRFWCRRWGVSREDSEDIFQEVFQAVSAGLEGFRREREGDTFRGWLRGIARNKVLTLFRRGQYQGEGGTDFYHKFLLVPARSGDAPFEGEDPEEEEVVDGIYQQALRLVRNEFEDRTWQAFWRTSVEGQAPVIVAEEFGVTAAAVRQSKSRVLRRLKEILGEPTESAGNSGPT